MNEIDLAMKILVVEEGFSKTPYYDTERIPTYGHGFVCGEKNMPLPTISISEENSLARLKSLISSNEKTFQNNPDLYAAYEKCNAVRRAVLLSMAHQLGIYGVIKFKGMLSAISKRDWEKAAKDCLDSLAARQTPKRYVRNASMLKFGVLDAYYKQ